MGLRNRMWNNLLFFIGILCVDGAARENRTLDLSLTKGVLYL